ncbi:MAG: PqqD family protein [Desulfobulbaceae bacterium]|nr:PqqD family protein [Desulfobulbaceae bacterium]
MFSRSRRKNHPRAGNILTRDHALECVPVRNPQITAQDNGDGELCLTYQVRIRPWFQNIVRKISGREDDIIERRLQLDVLGTTVWGMINGQRRTREIIDDFQSMHRLNRREAEISVTTFLKELGKRGLIAMREDRN